MEAPNLIVRPPRRWSEELAGVKWLPRLIDKARASQAGTLGSYLYGQSPIDADFLHQLGMGHTTFEALLAQASDDAAVITALRARDPQRFEAARRWSQSGLLTKWGWLVPSLDVDDGYVKTWYAPVVHVAANLIAGTAKAIFPRRSREAR